MKKTSYILALLAAASALLLAGCAKEKAVDTAEGELVGYTLQAEVGTTGAGLDIDTKVALNSDGVTPNWEEGDQILVLDEDKKPVGTDGKFTLNSGQGTARGKFTGTVYVGQKPAYAIYPASAATVSDTEPAATSVTAGTLAVPTGNDAGTIKGAVMLGSSTDGTTFTFTNACAVLKINTGDYGSDGGDPAIKSVKVSASYGETPAPIAGAFTIDWTKNLTIPKTSSGTMNEFTVDLPSTLQGDKKDVYIPIFPLPRNSSDVAPSMKFVFTNTGGRVAEVSHGFTAAIAANTIKDLGTAGGMEFGPDPEYWVDLGFVSENGYPLYISKRNVERIEDGNAFFTDDESSAGLSIEPKNVPSSIMCGGLLCRPFYSSELFSFIEGKQIKHSYNHDIEDVNNNVSIEFENGGIRVYSKIIENSNVFFPVGVYSGYGNWQGFEEQLAMFVSASSVTLSKPGSDDNHIRLVYEYISSNPISADSYYIVSLDGNKSAYSYSSSGSPNIWSLHSSAYRYTTSRETFFKIMTSILFNNNFRGYYQNVPPHISYSVSDPRFSVEGSYITCNDRACETNIYLFKDGELLETIRFAISSCFVKGTLVTISDGSKKPVEEITYDDKLKVWNFDKGCYDSANILWLTKAGLHNDHYIKCTFSDGTVLNVTGENSHHKLYNCDEHFFQGVTKMEPGTRVFTENGIVTLVSKEWIEEDVEYYNLITDRQVNCFAEGVLTSARYNNTYPIDGEMKFVKDDRERRPYKEFKAAGISREWYNGLRLGEQTDSLDVIRKYIDKCESQMAEKPAPTLWQRLCIWWKSIFG